MSAVSNESGLPELASRDDLATWKEGQEVRREQRQGSHELRLKMFQDWTIYGFMTVSLAASLAGGIGWLPWPDGQIAPMHVLLALLSGWIGTRIQTPHPPWTEDPDG